ncbi:MAG: hypothetical protein WC365_00930 [Candidatus Babeliales bacterium]|jgi:hypothetical protein
MSFYHGKGSKVYLNGNPMSSYMDTVNVSMAADTAETTVFTDTAKKYVMGIKSATLNAEGFGTGSTGEIDQYLDDAISTDANVWTWYPRESAGMPGYGMKGYNTQYDVKASISGAVRVATVCQSNVGKEPVKCVRAVAAATASSSGAALDNTAKSTNGGAGYLQVTATATSDAAIVIDHSSDGSSWATVATFDTAPAGASAQRVAIDGEIRRYVKASCTLTASCTFGVALNRN